MKLYERKETDHSHLMVVGGRLHHTTLYEANDGSKLWIQAGLYPPEYEIEDAQIKEEAP